MNTSGIKETRRANLRALMRRYDSPAEFARQIDRSPSFVSQMVGPTPTRGIGDKVARHIEQCLNLDPGWMDRSHNTGGEAGVSLPLLRVVLVSTEKALTEENIKLSPEEKADLVLTLYAVFDQSRPPDEDAIRRLIYLKATGRG